MTNAEKKILLKKFLDWLWLKEDIFLARSMAIGGEMWSEAGQSEKLISKFVESDELEEVVGGLREERK